MEEAQLLPLGLLWQGSPI